MDSAASPTSQRAAALEVAARVRAHFEEHKPKPASFPLMASRVIDLAEHPDVDARKLAHLIERDPAICTAVLAVANSAANSPVTPLTSVKQAVPRLGLKSVANIAVGVACRSLFDMEVRAQQQLFPDWWERLFHASMTEAFTCGFLSMEIQPQATEGIFLMGLLHDIGKSLGLRSLTALMVAGQEAPMTDDRLVEDILEINNVEIGALALASYNLPVEMVRVCATQNDDPLPKEWGTAHIIRVVSGLNQLRMETLETEAPIAHVQSSAAALELDSARIVQIAQQLSEHSAQVNALFSTSDAADESGYLDFVARCF